MAKLHFYYSSMNAGKSTTLLQSNYNYLERGMDTLLFVPKVDTRDGVGIISTRIGLKSAATIICDKFNLFEYTAAAIEKNPKIACVLIDEAQFITKQQVKQLCLITDQLNIPVLAYGLRTDYRGEPFEGSIYLLSLADLIIELKTICHCGRKATMNLRIDTQGNPVRKGNPICIGGNDQYIATCRKHFYEGKGGLIKKPFEHVPLSSRCDTSKDSSTKKNESLT